MGEKRETWLDKHWKDNGKSFVIVPLNENREHDAEKWEVVFG
jgi:hypothetical protein